MKHLPFLLKPAAKDYLWGGSRLNDDFNKNISVNPLAETWECSIHQDGQSAVASGEFCGQLLGEVLNAHPSYLGTHAAVVANGALPILIKLIDAKQDLSVQVHPDDDYAFEYEGSLGKTEMWYVLDAKKNTELVYGFNQDVTPLQVRHAIKTGTIRKLLNRVDVHKNDLFFIQPGMVHAVGSGALIAEIQENSNVTYRLYDYDRMDKNGQKRELHVDKALAVANLKSAAAPRQPMRVLKYRNGAASELIGRCKYFQVERILLNTEGRKMPEFRAEKNSFHALLCTEGCGVLFGENFMLNFFKGDCVFVPADSIPLKLHGQAQILNVSC